MSQLVYPALPGLMYPIGRSSVPPPVEIRTTPSQREYRARDAVYPRYQYSLQYEFLRTGRRGSELQSLVGLYEQVGGPFDTFLYTDPEDNTVTNQGFGVGDGSTAQFQLIRAWGGFAAPVYDPIFAGVQMTAYGGTVYDNFLIRSAEFGNAAWTKNTCTVTSNAAVAPDGSTTADRLDATGGDSYAVQLVSSFYPAPFTFSVWLRSVSGTATVSICTRQYPSNTDVNNTAVNLTTTWQRFTVSGTAVPGTTSIQVSVGGFSGFTSGESLYAWGAQLEDLAAASAGTLVTTDAPHKFSITNGLVQYQRVPDAGAVLSWSGSFYKRCRFLGDRMDTEQFMQDLYAAKRVEFITVKP